MWNWLSFSKNSTAQADVIFAKIKLVRRMATWEIFLTTLKESAWNSMQTVLGKSSPYDRASKCQKFVN